MTGETKVESVKEEAPVKEAEVEKSETKTEAKGEKSTATEKHNAELTKALAESEAKLNALVTEMEALKGARLELENTTNSLNTVKTELETANNTVAEYEKLISDLVEEKTKRIPEDLRDLVPSNMTLSQKLEWITKAESKNMFNKKVADNVEIGKPIGANTPSVDMNKMSASSLFSMAYNTVKK